MTNDLESLDFGEEPDKPAAAPRWLKVGMVAAASGILGGLAAAWFYRKTLAKLQGADGHTADEHTSTDSEDQDYDI